MTGAQLAVAPRLLYTGERTPETLSLKETGEEFQGEKGETTKTAASAKKKKTDRQGEEGTWSVNQRAMWQRRLKNLSSIFGQLASI